MVEAAGVERELAGFSNFLMVLGFWANSRRVSRLRLAQSSSVLPDPLISTVFLEKWRRRRENLPVVPAADRRSELSRGLHKSDLYRVW